MKYWIAFAICAIAATVPLLMTSVLPSADLPEHMAQVALWKHLGDSCTRYSEIFELNFATPYLAGYLIMRALALVMSVTAASKVTVWLSIVLFPLSLRALLRRTEADEWLSLLGFLFAYGYVFYWGFLNFALAIPVGIFAIAMLHASRTRVLAALMLLLLAAHALMFIFCAIVTIVVAIVRRAPKMLLTLVAPSILFAAFIVRLRAAETAAHGDITWWKTAPKRLLDIPSLLFANAWEPFGALLLIGIIIAIVITRPRITRDGSRWALFAIAMLLYLFAPLGAFGSTYLYTRFTWAVAVGAVFVINGPRRALPAARAIVIVLVIGWMCVLSMRFRAFGEEVRDYEQLVEMIPANRRIVQFNVEPFSENVPGPVYWHFGALYQVRRGGLIAWSFANFYPQIVRYRKGTEPLLTSHSTPLTGIDWPGMMQYDYLLVRGPDPRRWLFRDAPVEIPTERHVGEWWLFAMPRARSPQRDCPPLNE